MSGHVTYKALKTLLETNPTNVHDSHGSSASKGHLSDTELWELFTSLAMTCGKCSDAGIRTGNLVFIYHHLPEMYEMSGHLGNFREKNEKLKSLRTSPECFSDFGCDFQTSHSRPCCPPKVHAWNKKISPKNSGFQAKVGLTLIDSNPFWDIGCHRPVPETQHGVIPPTAR